MNPHVPPAVRRCPALLLGVILLFVASAAGASTITPKSGTQEIGLSGSVGLNPSDLNNYSVLYGRFLNRYFEIGGSYAETKAGSLTVRIFGIQPRFYFPNGSPILPFIGYIHDEAHTSSDFGSSTGKDDFLVGGVDYFVTPSVALTGTFRYRYPVDSTPSSSDFVLGLSTFIDGHLSFGGQAGDNVVHVPSTGSHEIGVSGDLTIHTGNAKNIQVTYGYMIRPDVELAAMVGGSNRTTQWKIKPEYCLRTGTPAVPYVAAFYGESRVKFGFNGSFFDPVETTKSRGVEVGVKYFVSSNVAVTAAYQYSDNTYDIPGNVPSPLRPDTHVSSIVTGVSVFIDGRHRRH